MRSKIFSTSLAFAFLLLITTIASAGQEIQITPYGERGLNPAIYDNKIVWLDKYINGSLHLRDLSAGKEIQITEDPWYSYLAVYNDKIVWGSGGQNIYLYNISTNNKTLLSIPESENQGARDSLTIYGDKIVWRDQSSGYRDIYMYDLSTYNKTRITTNQSTKDPVIYGDKIVWQEDPSFGFGSSYHDIYVYNLSTSNKTRVTTNKSASSPKVYGDRIVYMEGNNIYLHNLSTSIETQITFNGSRKDKLAIYGDRIVWQDGRNGNWDIYIYDLSEYKEIQITNDEADQLNPAIYGDKIVWEDYRNDRENRYYCSIYMYDFSAKPTMPFASFSANITSKSGNMLLTVLFTYNSTDGTPTSWYWDFGDGINSKHAQTATHTFKKPGTYDVSLTVTNFAGNSTLKKSNYITVTPQQAPIADFFSPEVYHANTYGGSVPTKTVSFVDNSTGSPTSWLWDFGDGNISTEQNPTHVYDVGGGYTVNLTVKNAVGSNTTSKYGYVLVGLGDGSVGREYFSSSVTSGDAPLKVTFHGGTGYANYWTFGDGSQQYVGENQTVEHTYLEPGQYTVSLYEDNVGGKAAITKYHYITVTGLTRPFASFTSEKVSVPKSLTIKFTDTSIGKPISWYWDFGDGASSTEQNPTHTYSAAGNYTVSLTASNENSTNSTFRVIDVFKTTGPFAYVTNDRNISVIDTATDKVVDTMEIGSGLVGVAVNPTGTKVYAANESNNTVSVIDTSISKIIATVNGLNSPYAIAITPDGKKAYVTNNSGAVFENGTVSVIDTGTNTVTDTIKVGSVPHGVAVSPDGAKVYVTNYYDISVIDTATNKVTATLNVGQYSDGIAVSPDGTEIYVTNGVSDNVSVIDTETNNVTATLPVGDDPVRVAVTPDGTKLYVTNHKGNTTSVINTTTNTVTATIPGNGPYGVSITPDGKKVYVTNLGSDLSGKTVSVIDTAANTVIATVKVGSYPREVAVAPYGK